MILLPPVDSPLSGTLNGLGDYHREGSGIEVDFTLPGRWIIRVLEQNIERRGAPRVIRSDSCSEMCSAEFQV